MNKHLKSTIAKLAAIDKNIGKAVTLPAVDSWPQTMHQFDKISLWAIKAALASRRPLLVRGEPGTGKSQLARAAAHVLGRAFAFEVVHARSEYRDLQYSFDAVSRLGEAQALAASGGKQDIQAALNPLKFLCPGVLWWAFDWESAAKQYAGSTHKTRKPSTPEGWGQEDGVVVLIDEIDKADSDLPNGLLETLGNGMFTVPHLHTGFTIGVSPATPPPLVVITTNEERELPAAFIRRCLVLYLELPEKKDKLISWLIGRGTIHFHDVCSEAVLKEAAEQLWQDRKDALEKGLPAPGQAEYLDILMAVSGISEKEKKQLEALEAIRDFALKKNPKDNY